MNKEELIELLNSDTEYKKDIDEANEWIKEFVAMPDDKKSKAGAKYITDAGGILFAAEEILSGDYEDDVEELRPKEGEFFNKSCLPLFQGYVVSIHYRIALVNREVHKVINPWMKFEDEATPFDEFVDALISKNQGEWLVRGYVPQYLIELGVKFE